MREGGIGVTHDAHVRYGFLVLRGGGAPPSLAVMLRGRQVHELDGIDHCRLRFGVVRYGLWIGV